MTETINQHMIAFWLTAMKQIAATRHSLREDNCVIPPEINRLHRNSVRNFAACSIGRSFGTFSEAVAWARDIAVISDGRRIAVTRLTKTDYTSRQYSEYAVYPDDAVPQGPGYIRVEILTRVTE